MIQPQSTDRPASAVQARPLASAGRPARLRWPIVALAVALAAVAVAGFSLAPRLVGGGKQTAATTFTVKRGSLTVVVTADGTVRSDSTVDIKSKLRGVNAILEIVPESTRISHAGQFLCQLDTSDLEAQRDNQVIKVKQTQAAATQAEKELEIQIAQNDSEIRGAIQARDFAKLDLEKFEKGDKLQEQQAATNDIIIANEELKRAEDKYKWSAELAKNGYISDSELKADELAVTKCRLAVDLAETRKRVQEKYTHKKTLAQLTSAVTEAEAELKRTEASCAAREGKTRSDLETKQESWRLEQVQLDKLVEQIAAGRITAPQPGLVVYASTTNPRWNRTMIEAGAQIRENESIITLPDLSVMVADVTVPEARRTQISDDQAVTVRVEAQPDIPLRAVVKSRGLMPAQQDWMRRGDVQQFQVVIAIKNPPEWLLPGLRCSAEILVADLKDVISVPVAAVFTRDGKPFCYVADGGNVCAVPVLLGLDDDKMVEVKAGLEVGWNVLLAEPSGGEKIALEKPTFEAPRPADSATDRPGGQQSEQPGQQGQPGQPVATQPASQPDELSSQQIAQIIERIRQADPQRAEALEKMSLDEQRKALKNRPRRPRGDGSGDRQGGDRSRRPR